MALALYRKYRPKTFTEVIGQDHVTEPLIQALRTGRLNHAYLFSGPRGCGKTSSARILARSLNCAQGPTPDPCDECDSCRALAPDGPGSIDVIEIDAASHGGVDDARELRERAFFAPAISRYKIYIIDEAHMVSSAGFNALLKLVEEPPDYVKFVFATTEPEKVLGTIRSRTHHYPFRLIPPGVLRPYLELLAQSEGVQVEAPVFPLIVRAGGGSARDSLSVLDQLIAGSGDEGVTYARAVSLLGVTDVALIDDMIDALTAGDGGAAFGAIDRLAEAGHDSRRFAGDLLQRLRDLIILRQLPDAGARGLLDAPDDELVRMQAQSGQIGSGTLSRYADIVHTGMVEMRGATSPRLLLELIIARMLLPTVDDSTSALLQRLERLESGSPPSFSPTPAPAPTSATRPDTDAAPSAPAQPGGSAQAAARAAAQAAARPTPTTRQPATSAPATSAPAATAHSGSAQSSSAPVASAQPGSAISAQPGPAASGTPASAASGLASSAQPEPASSGSDGSASSGTTASATSGPAGSPQPRSASSGTDASAATRSAGSAQFAASGPDGSASSGQSASEPVAVASGGQGGSGSVAARGARSGGGQGAASASPGTPSAAQADSPGASSAGGSGRGRASTMETASTTPAPRSAPVSATSDEGWPEVAVSGAQPAAARAASSAAPASASASDSNAEDSAPQGNATSPSGLDAEGVRRCWDEIVRSVSQSSKKAAAFAREAVVREVDGSTLILVFKHKIHADGVNNEPAPLLEAVHQVLGGVWSVRCEIGGDQRPSSPVDRPGPARQAAAPAAQERPSPAKAPPAARRAAGAAGAAAAGVPQDEEAPYDPEFDGPPRSGGSAPTAEGFDPGDEPDTDTDSLAVRQTSEEQALDSLRKSFNLEKIAENGR